MTRPIHVGVHPDGSGQLELCHLIKEDDGSFRICGRFGARVNGGDSEHVHCSGRKGRKGRGRKCDVALTVPFVISSQAIVHIARHTPAEEGMGAT